MAKKNQKKQVADNPLNQEKLGVRELQFLLGEHISAVSYLFHIVCDKARIPYKSGIKLPVGVISTYSGINIAEKIEQQTIIYMKHRDSKSAILNDPKCVIKGDFVGKWKPLKRFLSEEDQEIIASN